MTYLFKKAFHVYLRFQYGTEILLGPNTCLTFCPILYPSIRDIAVVSSVFSTDVVTRVRTVISRLPLLTVYGYTVRFLSMITDLDSYPAELFVASGPFSELLPVSLLSYLFGGFDNLPSKLFLSHFFC